MSFAFIVSALLKATAGVLPWMDYSESTSFGHAEYENPWLFVAVALLAGLVEEPLLAALPVLLLAGRLPIAWIVVLGGVMRGTLHLYYGVSGFVWAFIWGAAAVWVYYRYRRLWVLVLFHGLVLNIGALGLPPDVPEWLWAATAVLFKFMALIGLSMYWMRKNPKWFRAMLRKCSPDRAAARFSASAKNNVE
ncbi:CPBP family intramembrane metalloprotease [Rhodococcus hoagii]|nr:CPBP family intramembrane metalloprotease [Prescottella equi]NKR53115.1 CPBP family intramembrane metalloprotease [Prescottella equi]